MSAGSESAVRAAYAAYARGDVAGVLEFVRPARNYAVLTVRDGQITALRACRDHDEACELASIG